MSYLLRRLGASVVTVWFIVTLSFVLLRLTPGDPARIWLADYATPDLHARVRAEMGLDQPVWIQYARYLQKLATGDLGQSFRTNQDVKTQLFQQYPYTLHLTAASLAVALLLGLPAGLLAAVRRGSVTDLGIMVAAVAWVSAPAFWVGLLFIILFSVKLKLFPITGAGDPGDLLGQLRHLVLPAVATGARGMAVIARMSRSALLEVLGEDYIRTARAKGLAERVVLWRHALKGALSPIISVTGIELAALLGGAVVAETVFSRPGIGRLLVVSISSRDYPMLQAAILFFALAVVVVNLVTDLCYALADPRVRFE